MPKKIYAETEETISDFSNEIDTSLSYNVLITDPISNPNDNYEILETMINFKFSLLLP